MSTEESAEMREFLLGKETLKEESLNWFPADDHQPLNMFKEELFFDEAFEWKTEGNDFSVEELLGSCLNENEETLARGGHLEESGHSSSSSSGMTNAMKDEDLEAFKDIVSLPFDDVIDSLDQPGFEAASDSGLSSDNITEFMLSPSSGDVSPEPGMDTSADVTDSASEVSSTSDLGSMGSVGGTSPNGSFSTTPLRFDLSGASPSIVTSCDDDIEMKNLPVPLNSGTTEKATPIILSRPSSTSSSTAFIATRPAGPLSKTQNVASIPSVKVVEVASPTTVDKFSSVSVAKSNSSSPLHVPTTITTRAPVLTKVRLDSNGVLSKSGSSSSSSSSSSPQTIVVTQAGKASGPIIRSGTILKTGSGGRPILVPVNVNVGDLSQVKKMKSFKIISASSAGGTRPVVSGIRTLVSTVRPMSVSSSSSSPSPSISASTSSTPTRTTFYTTSKGSDGRPLLKVTPTAFVTPTAHSANVSVTPAYVKDEPSDDEIPQPNQELVLTEEERRLMRKEGLVLPSRYPLTKQEERDLKRIRRKIRNKISAQDSRKRKKEYVDGLEDRVKNCTEENQQLKKQLKTLEKQNETLLAQLKKIHRLVGVRLPNNKPPTHASTAIMMLILSAALLVVPSLRSQEGKGEGDLSRDNKLPSSGHSRTLLEVQNNALNMQNLEGFQDTDEDGLDTLDFSTNALTDHDYAPVTKKARFDAIADFFTPPSMDKTLPRQNGDPPDGFGNLNGVAAIIGAMLDRLGNNWTDPGGSIGTSMNLTPNNGTPERSSSVVVNLNHGKRFRDDLELE